MAKHIALLFLCALILVDARIGFAAERGGPIFARESTLMAFWRVRNLASVDARMGKFLQMIYSGSAVERPLSRTIGRAVFNSKMMAVQNDSWLEAVLFSLPQEADNDWVYILRATGEDAYTAALLDTGNIRREVREEGIVRFRQTADDRFITFYVAFTGENLVITGQSRAAVERARMLYSFTSETGLFSGYTTDLACAIHFNRYLLSKPRMLSIFTEMIHRDVVRDLAGGQAKQNNPLSLGLKRALVGTVDLVREVAVAEMTADFREDALALEAGLVARYGGGIHYALSNIHGAGDKTALPVALDELEQILPAEATGVSRGRLWPEMYEQILAGLAGAMQAAFARPTPPDVLTAARSFLTLSKEAGPQGYASALVDSPAGAKGAGPVLVSVIRWSDAKKLRDLWDTGSRLMSEGQLNELLAERGMKLQIDNDPATVTIGGWPVSRTLITPTSTYFNLPGGLGKPQHYLSVLAGRYLLLAIAAGPVSHEQYQLTEPYMMEVLGKMVARLPGGLSLPVSDPALPVAKTPVPARRAALLPAVKPEEVFCFKANPLRVIQVAVHAESIWPDPAEPNRLPVPWGQFYDEFMRFPAGTDGIQLQCDGTEDGLKFELLLPVKALAELANAGLDFSAPAVKE